MEKILAETENVTALFGHHKDTFKNLPEGFELIFDELDPEYPIYVARKGIFEKTIITEYFEN